MRRLAWLGLLCIALGTLLFSGSLVLGAMIWASTILLDYYRQTYRQEAETIQTQTAEPMTEGYDADT